MNPTPDDPVNPEWRLIQLGLLPNPNECNTMAMEGRLGSSGVLVEPYERLLHEFAERIAWQQSQLDTATSDLYQARSKVAQLERAVALLGREYPLEELHRRMVAFVLGWPDPGPAPERGPTWEALAPGLRQAVVLLADDFGPAGLVAAAQQYQARVAADGEAKARAALGGRGSDGPDWG